MEEEGGEVQDRDLSERRELRTDRMSMVGLGKLGCCLAAVFAESGIDVLGVDIEEKVVHAVNAGIAPFSEPGLHEILRRIGGRRLRATDRADRAIGETDITFVLVPTPSNDDGTFSNRYVETALTSLATALRDSDKPYHLFVISSTVVPGSTEGSFIPLIEAVSGRTFNEGFGVCYDPDFVALGSVVRDFQNPDFVLIGEGCPEDGEVIASLHHQMCENAPPVSRMSIISAEIAKVSLNAYITVKISFANTLANLCEGIPGADVDAITSTVGRDKRISPRYFKGGPAYGGDCFPRDTAAFRAFAASQNDSAEIVSAVERVNQRQKQRLIDRVLGLAEEMGEPRVGVLGLAFKPGTFVVTESPGVEIIPPVLERGLQVVAFDPIANDQATILFRDGVRAVRSAERCLAASDLWVLTQPMPELLSAVRSWSEDRPVTLLDCWRVLDPSELAPSIRYVPFGRSS